LEYQKTNSRATYYFLITMLNGFVLLCAKTCYAFHIITGRGARFN